MIALLLFAAFTAHYLPYVDYGMDDLSMPNITVVNGLRTTALPCMLSDHPKKIWMFGGSTIFGLYNDDAHTIPSFLQKSLCAHGIDAHVTNYGVIGYTTTQEMLQLLLLLRSGQHPDAVLFYDGINDVYSAYQNGAAGVPENMQHRSIEFNSRYKLNLYGWFRGTRLGNGIAGAWKHLSSQTPTPSSAMPPKDLSLDIIKTYQWNMQMVRFLANENNFTATFFWQPIANEGFDTDQQFTGEYAHATERLFSTDTSVHDLSSFFVNISETVFIDQFHLTNDGNRIIAEKLQ